MIRPRALAAAFLIAGLFACGRTVAPPDGEATAAPAAIALLDDTGYELRLDRPPERVVSVAPSLTEVVAAAGCESALVGVTIHCDHPSSVAGLPKSGSYVRPNIEAILALKPDLVLMVFDGAPKEAVMKLRALGLKVAVLRSSNRADVLKNIRWVGTALGARERAERAAVAMETRYDAVAATVADLPRPRVLFSIATDPVITVGRTSFINDLIRDAGGENIAGDQEDPYPRMTMETIVALAPEIIVYSSGRGPEADSPRQRSYWKRWPTIPAVRNGGLREIEGSVIGRPGPRLATALAQLAIALHPERAAAIEAALGDSLIAASPPR